MMNNIVTRCIILDLKLYYNRDEYTSLILTVDMIKHVCYEYNEANMNYKYSFKFY